MPTYEGRHVAAAAFAGAAATASVLALAYSIQRRRAYHRAAGMLETEDNRAQTAGQGSRWTKPVVVATPGLEALSRQLQKSLGCDIYDEKDGPTISLQSFKSGDPDMKFNWKRVVGRHIVFLFDTVDQGRLFEQLSLLQALQGFAVPDGEDKMSKWKTYVNRGKYSWGRASKITVVLPWYRPCQMERTSRWQLKDGKWINSDPEGQWLDVPTAQYFARLLATPGSVPPLPGPSAAMDGMPIHPLWRPPLELMFVELHEEAPISHSVSDLGATIRMERFVPFFLKTFQSGKTYPGKGHMFILFPDRGAYDRYHESVTEVLGLEPDHVLYIKKTRVGESTAQEQKLYYVRADGKTEGEKTSFEKGDSVLIIDDFTNSGGTLFGGVNLVRNVAGSKAADLTVSIFVSHLLAAYDPSCVNGIKEKLEKLGKSCHFYTTNSIPKTTDILRGHPQATVMDLSDFLADMVRMDHF